MNQRQFLVETLRGTNRSITSEQAKLFGIAKLSSRMSELRAAGLRIRTYPMREGKHGRPAVRYMISARDIKGSRSKIAV